jgi:hypothetical protein
MSAINPPDSPPASPVISEGLATKMGKWGTLLLAIVTVATPLLPDVSGGDTRFFAALTAAVGIATILGRMLQSAAALFGGTASGALPVTGVGGSGVTDVDEDPDPHGELLDLPEDDPPVPPGLLADPRPVTDDPQA